MTTLGIAQHQDGTQADGCCGILHCPLMLNQCTAVLAVRIPPILLHIQYTVNSESEVRPSMLCFCTCPSVHLVLRSRDALSVLPTGPLQPQPLHPVCLRICSAFSFLGSGSMVRALCFSSRFSRFITLACFVVGRRMAQLS
jgi:hypothetical protein